MNRRRNFYIGFALVVVTLAVFWPAVHHDFLNFDDDLYVTDKPMVQQGLTFEGVLWAFSNFEASNWHPVTWLSHMLDCTLFQLFPGGHHLINVALHALNALLLFLLLQRMTGAAWRSALVAALFAWHPLHVESVAWVAERKDMLSTLFMILTIRAYVRYAEQPGVLRYAGMLAWFALGLMSKAMLVTLPLVLLLLDYWPLGRMHWSSRQDTESDAAWPLRLAPKLSTLFLEKIPLFGMAAAAGVVTLLAQKEGGALQSLTALPLSTRVANATTAYAAYLGKTFWPADLAIPYPLRGHWEIAGVIASALILGAITVLVLLGHRRAQYLPVGWFWYLGTLVPVIGLVQVGGQAMADRYTYVPLIGLFMALVWAAAAWSAHWRVSQVAVATTSVAVVLACLVSTSGQLQYWQNSVVLFQNAIRVTGDNLGAHNNLGVALSDLGRSEEAMAHYFEALRIKPNYVKAHYNLSLEYVSRGQISQAITQLYETLWLSPTEPSVHNNLGVMLAQQERYPEAVSHLTAAVKLQPDYPKAHLNLAGALANQGRYPEALTHFRVATELKPDWPEALAGWAQALATCPDPTLRDGARAVPLAERACELTQRSQPPYLNTLAEAYAETGRFEEAVETAEEALRLASPNGQEQLAAQIQDRLRAYKTGRTGREPL